MCPPQPTALPPFLRWQTLRLKHWLLLIPLRLQWKRFTRAVNLLAKYFLWFLFCPLLSPSLPYTPVGFFPWRLWQRWRDPGIKKWAKVISRLRVEVCSRLNVAATHLSSVKGEEIPLALWCCYFQSICFVSQGFLFIHQAIWSWPESVSGQTLLSININSRSTFFFSYLSRGVQGTLHESWNVVIIDMCTQTTLCVITSPTGISLLFTMKLGHFLSNVCPS